MARVKIGDYVMAPKNFENTPSTHYIEKGRKYKVVEVYEGGDSFCIKGQAGKVCFCLTHRCSHLNFLDWVVIPKQSPMKRVINFLTFKK